MFFMSSSTVLSDSVVFNYRKLYPNPCFSRNRSNFVAQLNGKRRRKLCGLVAHSKNWSRNWWERLIFDENGNWFGSKDVEETEDVFESMYDDDAPEEDNFEAWKRRAEAIVELREAQEEMKKEESRRWEDWLVDGSDGVGATSSWEQDWDDKVDELREDVFSDPGEIVRVGGLAELVKEAVFGRENDETLYEDRVSRYAIFSSAKFLAVLIIIPWALDFVVHDYVLMPILDRYVKLVPLAAEVLDVRRYQKLEMVRELKVDRAIYRFDVELGRSPPLSDDEIWVELREKALEMRDELRLENRIAFANIWSDMVFGISLFLLLYFNQSKAALLKFTSLKLIKNSSDVGKAMFILFITETIYGYHSGMAWEAVSGLILEHYGLEVDQVALVIFVGTIPNLIEVYAIFWLYKILPAVNLKVSRIIARVGRH